MKTLVKIGLLAAAAVVAYKVYKETKEVASGAVHEGTKAAAEHVVLKLINETNQK